MCVYFKKGWGWVGDINLCKPGGMDCLSQEREIYLHFRTGCHSVINSSFLRRGKKENTWKVLVYHICCWTLVVVSNRHSRKYFKRRGFALNLFG